MQNRTPCETGDEKLDRLVHVGIIKAIEIKDTKGYCAGKNFHMHSLAMTLENGIKIVKYDDPKKTISITVGETVYTRFIEPDSLSKFKLFNTQNPTYLYNKDTGKFLAIITPEEFNKIFNFLPKDIQEICEGRIETPTGKLLLADNGKCAVYAV